MRGSFRPSLWAMMRMTILTISRLEKGSPSRSKAKPAIFFMGFERLLAPIPW